MPKRNKKEKFENLKLHGYKKMKITKVKRE